MQACQASATVRRSRASITSTPSAPGQNTRTESGLPSPPCGPSTAKGSPCVPATIASIAVSSGCQAGRFGLRRPWSSARRAHGWASVFGRHRQQAVDRQPQPGRPLDRLIGDLFGDPVDEEEVEEPAARRLVRGHDGRLRWRPASRHRETGAWRHRARPSRGRAPAAWCRRAPPCGGSPSGRRSRRSAACWRCRAAAKPCDGARRWRGATRPRNR